MAFKMKGFPMMATSALKRHDNPPTDHPPLQPSEHKDTEITRGKGYEDINDIESRIEFIQEDITNQDGKATKQQKKDLATLKAKLKELKAKK